MLPLFFVGAAIMASGVIYSLVDRARTGVLFRRKDVAFPPIIIGWLMAMSAMALLALS